MKVDKSFQIGAKHLHLFLESRFPTRWLTLLFPLLWRIKYMSTRLITCMRYLVVWSFFPPSFFSCLRDASCFNLVHSNWDGSGLSKKQKESKRLFLLNLLPLFYFHQSSISAIIVQMRQKKGKNGARKRCFSLKKPRAHQIFFSNKTH